MWNLPCLDIVIGSILGDGHLTRPYKAGGNSGLYIKYDDKALDYLKWLHSTLSSIEPLSIKAKVVGGYHQHYFQTRASKKIGDLRRIFYPKGKKIIPLDIKNLLLSPRSLAVWYMDDGTLDNRAKYHRNAMFATYGFSFKDCYLLSGQLKEIFDVDVSVTKCTMRNKVYPRLYVKSCSMDRFISLISPYIHPVFKYKIA